MEKFLKKCGYKHGNEKPELDFAFGETEPFPWAMIMDDPDAMAAVGKVWVHWLVYGNTGRYISSNYSRN